MRREGEGGGGEGREGEERKPASTIHTNNHKHSTLGEVINILLKRTKSKRKFQLFGGNVNATYQNPWNQIK